MISFMKKLQKEKLDIQDNKELKMLYYFWLGEDAEWAQQIDEDYDGDWEAFEENEEMKRFGY